MDDLLSIALSNAVAAAVLALIAAVTGAVCRRPALVHGLWLLVLLKLLTPPLVRIPIAWPSAPESNQVDVTAFATDEPVPESTPSPLEQPALALVLPASAEDEPAASIDAATVPPTPDPADPPLWPRMLPLVWLAGSLAWFALALMRLGQYRRLLRFARRAPAALQERAARLARRVGLPRCPRVDLLPGRIAPMLWAVGGSPRLLVPADLLDVLGDEQLDTLLVHELAHLRRRDHWVRALEFVVMGLYWWHPIVWYARRELREAEEQCCDAWVVSTLPGAGRTYATALMDTLDFLSMARPAVPPLASGIGHVADLKRRLTMIMRGTTPRALSWPGLIMLALGAFFLPLLPALHGQAADKENTDNKMDKQKIEKDVKAEVERAKAALKQAQANLEAARARAEVAHAELLQKEAQQAAALEAQQAAALEKWRAIATVRAAKESQKPGHTQDEKKPQMVRIEIVMDAEGLNIEELSKKLAKLLPDGKARIRIEGVGGKVQIDHGTGRIEYFRKDGDLFYRKKGTLAPPDVPTPKPPRPEKPGVPGSISPPAIAPQEKRINELEKKLEKVLQELHELRKQMKEPRSQSARPPSSLEVPFDPERVFIPTPDAPKKP